MCVCVCECEVCVCKVQGAIGSMCKVIMSRSPGVYSHMQVMATEGVRLNGLLSIHVAVHTFKHVHYSGICLSRLPRASLQISHHTRSEYLLCSRIQLHCQKYVCLCVCLCVCVCVCVCVFVYVCV